ncbi:hypothetical protein [Apilactobacillus kunkeei]|uniref:hypothetical protein n=1 Tax=Apilactobacillus kunkeei TaxID=148814 RepID=UPI0006C4BE37|nr:hypothetical protein [Apilactobacillus kunkeei]KOY70955.1 Uncharacterized protein RZ55_00360 [Apilactobacillus kunkeei]KPN80823.1 Uncharacterized protein RZ76_00360 [Apilactobacillus kunkeei]
MILDIPNSAIINRIIPKDRFNFKNPTSIERIRWIAKLSTITINVLSNNVNEIEVISVDIPDFDINVIKEIKDKIPQEILFIVNEDIAVMEYNKQFFSKKIDSKLSMTGISTDDIRDNFVRQILGIGGTSVPLTDQINKYNKLKQLEKNITDINNKIKNISQLNKKQELARKRYVLEQSKIKIEGEL